MPLSRRALGYLSEDKTSRDIIKGMTFCSCKGIVTPLGHCKPLQHHLSGTILTECGRSARCDCSTFLQYWAIIRTPVVASWRVRRGNIPSMYKLVVYSNPRNTWTGVKGDGKEGGGRGGGCSSPPPPLPGIMSGEACACRHTPPRLDAGGSFHSGTRRCHGRWFGSRRNSSKAWNLEECLPSGSGWLSTRIFTLLENLM